MKKIIGVGIVAGIAVGLFYFTPLSDIGKPLEKKKKDSDFPAAGVCELSDGETVRIEIHEDVPSPRCAKILPMQKLEVVNKTGSPITIGFDAKYKELKNILLESEESHIFSRPAEEYFEFGVHHLLSTPHAGPAIWLVDATPYLHSFKDFEVTETFEGTPALPDFGSSPEAKDFKTAIGRATVAGPNFAGHYTVAEWGCGTSCQMHAVIDAKTGAIVGYGFGSALGAEYYLNSRLLILNPPRFIESKETTPPGVSIEYYELRNGELLLIEKQSP